MLIDQLRICAECALDSPNGKTYLNAAARPMLKEAADEIERLRAALEPFAEVARWAERNGHDLVKDFDMLLRGPGKEFAGHLQAQAPAFIAAAAALNIHKRPE